MLKNALAIGIIASCGVCIPIAILAHAVDLELKKIAEALIIQNDETN